MPDKKKTAPLATNGTVTTSDACHNQYDNDSTVSLDIQEDFEDLTYNGLLKSVTDNYLLGLDLDMPPSPAEVESQLLQATNNAIESYNLGPRDPSAPPALRLRKRIPMRDPLTCVFASFARWFRGRSRRLSSICTTRSACAG